MSVFQNGLFMCGFDMLTSTAANTIFGGANTMTATNARFGDGQANVFASGSRGFLTLGANLTRVIEGIYVYMAVLPTSGFAKLLDFFDATAGGIQIQLMVGSLGQLQFFLSNGTTAVGTVSANGVIQAARGSYIQTDVTINSTTGVVKCYVDTSGTSAIISNTAVNSQSTANAYTNQIGFTGAGGNTYFDDLYLLDLTGSAPFNAILGNVHCHWDPPTSDSSPNAFSTQPSQTAGNHYKNVNPTTTPSGTAYNFDATAGDEELYGFPALSASKVFAITEWVYNELDAAGARTVSTVLSSSSVLETGTAFTPASTFGYAYHISTTDPNTSAAWSSGTVAAAQAAKLGIEVVT